MCWLKFIDLNLLDWQLPFACTSTTFLLLDVIGSCGKNKRESYFVYRMFMNTVLSVIAN